METAEWSLVGDKLRSAEASKHEMYCQSCSALHQIYTSRRTLVESFLHQEELQKKHGNLEYEGNLGLFAAYNLLYCIIPDSLMDSKASNEVWDIVS